MTFEEAKKILEKEGFELEKRSGITVGSIGEFPKWEKIAVKEAMIVIAKNSYVALMDMSIYEARKARLKKEYEENTKASGPGEEQTKEKKGIIYPTTFPKADFYHKYFLNEGYSALKESVSQFNDALLDEQAKKIERLKNENEDWKSWHEMQNRQIALSNIAFRNEKNRLGKEISKLNSIIHGKNAVLSDVAEELRLAKIREKNLTEVCQKYVKENEKLKKELADKVVDKIDAQALKSAESALAWKEKTITYKDMALAYYEKKIAEKDDVIADLGKELEEKIKLVEVVRKGSKEYCDYGIAAEKMIQKMADVIVYDRPVFSKDFEQYRLWANGYRFNPQLPEIGEEEEKKFSPVKDTHPTEDSPKEVEMDEILEYVRKALEKGHTVSIDYDKAEEGGDQSATILECGKDIDDVFEEIKRLCQE